MNGQIEPPNTILQAIELNSSCSGQVHSSKPGTGHGYESTEPKCILAVLHAPSIIFPLRSADAKSRKII